MTQNAAVILNKLAALCSKSEKCSSDALDYMISRGCTDKDAAEGLKYLIQNGFVNDWRYAESYFKDRFRFGKWGINKIILGLRLKKIPQEIITAVTDENYDEESEKTVIKSELAKKLRGIKSGLPKWKVREKLMRFSLSRGYCAGMSGRAVEELTENF